MSGTLSSIASCQGVYMYCVVSNIDVNYWKKDIWTCHLYVACPLPKALSGSRGQLAPLNTDYTKVYSVHLDECGIITKRYHDRQVTLRDAGLKDQQAVIVLVIHLC